MSTSNYIESLNKLLLGKDLDFLTTEVVFSELLGGNLTPAQIAGLIVAMRIKGETPEEVAGAASVMRRLVTPVKVSNPDKVIDLCGTGGDGAHTFNISTSCMFVLAACGAVVGKHGGRSVSSSSGSADVLEALGANINLSPAQVSQCMDEVGVGFMFAPNHHSAMRFAGPVRKELGVRTIFNVLGPLTNPAGAKRQVMGVYDKSLLQLQAEVLKKLGSTHAIILHGANGMDEACVECETHVAELKDGAIRQYTIKPEDFGLERRSHQVIGASSVDESMLKMRQALAGQGGAIADIVALNSGIGLYVAGLATDIGMGVQLAKKAMLDGSASAAMDRFVETTGKLAGGDQ